MIGIVLDGEGLELAADLDISDSYLLNAPPSNGLSMSVELLIRASEDFLNDSDENVVIGVSTSGVTFSIAANKAGIPAASCGSREDIDEVVSDDHFDIRMIDFRAAHGPREIKAFAEYFVRARWAGL